MRNTKKEDGEQIEEFRFFPLAVILACGIIVIGIGIYLTLSNKLTVGITQPGRSGIGGGQSYILSGPSIIIIGCALCVFPTYQLIKRAVRKKAKI